MVIIKREILPYLNVLSVYIYIFVYLASWQTSACNTMAMTKIEKQLSKGV